LIICAIVGVSKSGKTTTVTELVRELKKRGHRVGTVKSVFCPNFSLDKPGSNTWKHREAGADLVCLKGKAEMDLMMETDLTGAVYEQFPVDILLLEGEYELAVPRIICVREEDEAKERVNGDAIAVTGVISEKRSHCCGLPVYHPVRDRAVLADLVEKLPEAWFPLPLQPIPESVSAYCRHRCGRRTDLSLLTAHPRDTVRKHLFLTGEKQIGKSTILSRILAEPDIAGDGQKNIAGFRTYPFSIGEERRGFYMHSYRPVAVCENDLPVLIRMGERTIVPVPETFELLGCALLRDAISEPSRLVVLDELGKAEKKADIFKQTVFRLLDSQDLVIGVLQKNSGDFALQIAEREDVKVYEVTEENRDRLPSELIAEIRRTIRR